MTISRGGGDHTVKTQAWRVDFGTSAASKGGKDDEGVGSGGDGDGERRSKRELLEELPWQVIGIMSERSLRDLRAKKNEHDQELRDRLGIPADVPVRSVLRIAYACCKNTVPLTTAREVD